ncbi:MAG: pyridoxamine 5'-phosphate oxidase family protein [Candidatus Heimdallarchaeota archaeon]|nr:pyridoxamine 5'-phosphate oxidase family protein [Candidatus Heimdallarchaeota archaeon]
MRRDDLQSNDIAQKEELERELVGHLGVIVQNQVRIIPLNFVVIGSNIYFHGALAGEKYELIKTGCSASFSIDKPYSFISSTFQSDSFACNASHYFKSIHYIGHVEIVQDLTEKAQVLQKLMEKYQDPSSFTSITASEALYKAMISQTAVFKMQVTSYTMKIKFGQNESESTIEKIISGLDKRGTALDLDTIKQIKYFRQ